jgi:hypothetical protein
LDWNNYQTRKLGSRVPQSRLEAAGSLRTRASIVSGKTIQQKIGLCDSEMLRTMVVDERDMSADFQRRLRLSLIALLMLSACSTADHEAANFKRAQKLRQNALLAARRGDTASALNDIDRVQVLVPLTSRSPGMTPPYMGGPKHRAIAPAAGGITCNNIGINRFSCF